jgi:hypothetical protein
MRIRDPGCKIWIRDPGMKKIGSRINILDPQHFCHTQKRRKRERVECNAVLADEAFH